MHSRWRWPIVMGMVLLALGCKNARQEKPAVPELQQEAAELPPTGEASAQTYTFTKWSTSADGALSLRLMAPARSIPADKPIVLLAELRNNMDKALYVLRPLADNFAAWTSFEIKGPAGAIQYTGPWWEYGLGSDAFALLPPGRTIRGRIELIIDNFAGSDKPGRYTIIYPYAVEAYYQKTAALVGFCKESDLWIGEIRSEPITITKE